MTAWMTAGESSDEVGRLRARLLEVVIATLSICAVAGLATTLLVGYRRMALILALALPVLLASSWLARRGRATWAGILVVAAMQTVVTLMSYVGFGIHDATTILYALAILVASLLLSRALYLLYVAVVIVNAIVLVYVQLTSRVVFNPSSVGLDTMVTVPVLLLACALIARVMTENLRHSLVRARVKSRSLERAEAEQRRLVAELEGKNAELEHLARIVSHDLKSPLLTIRGMLGFLQKDLAAGNLERVRSDAARVDQAAAKMQNLVGELQALFEAGRMPSPPEEVAFGELAAEAVSLVSGRLEQRGVAVDVAGDLPVVKVVRPRLVSVLQNLIENAVKFMGEQTGPRIEIGAETVRDETGEDETVFFVRDNGIGLEAGQLGRIFRLFERLDHSAEGTGMGLALVQRIVEVHGGRIWAESDGPGMGTTFRFTLGDSKAPGSP